MNKSELVKLIAINADITKASAARALEATTEAITRTLKKGGAVQIAGFGTFDAARRAARKGKNLRTGEDITIAARNAPTFKASKALKDALN